MRAWRIWTLLWLVDGILPHDELKDFKSATTALPDVSSMNQTSRGKPLTASLSLSGGKLNSSPTVNVDGESATSARSLPITNTEGFLGSTPPMEDKSALTVAALGVISFIVILVVVVIVLVSIVSLKFRCHYCKDMEEKQKPQHLEVSYSCPDAADPDAAKTNITLVSMKNLNANNSKGIMKTTVTCEEQ
ncbi:endothelial cell-specific chemotaxis regulator [Paroedura picta]|uniref:endothelial cell-specific chemotaxis regulator n=1 Tax=Paroedura picta TaxID=143630 RepID=UPI004056196D